VATQEFKTNQQRAERAGQTDVPSLRRGRAGALNTGTGRTDQESAKPREHGIELLARHRPLPRSG